MAQHLAGYKIPYSRRKPSIWIPCPEEDRIKLGGRQIRPGQLQQGLPVILTPLQPFLSEEEVAMQRDFRVDRLSKKDRKSFGHDREKEGPFSPREKILEEGPLGAVAIFMGHQEGKILKALIPLQPESNRRHAVDIHGHPIRAEEADEKIDRDRKSTRLNSS